MIRLQLKCYYSLTHAIFPIKVIFVISDVRKTIDDLKKVMKNFESRVEFTEDLQKMSDVSIVFSVLFFFWKKFHVEQNLVAKEQISESSNAFRHLSSVVGARF